jgi:NCAIR mutase (PurE)-related protein
MAGLRDDLRVLLQSVREGKTSPDEALHLLSLLPFRELGFARVDVHRELRQGAPEAVLGSGKTPEQVALIAQALLEGGAGSVLVTRADTEMRAAVRDVAPDAEQDPVALCV